MIHVGPYTYHHWADGSRTLNLRVEGYPLHAPDLRERGWDCFFVARHGMSHTVWTYRFVEGLAERERERQLNLRTCQRLRGSRYGFKFQGA